MFPQEKIGPQEERRRTVKYSNDMQPTEYIDGILNCGPLHQTLIAAERNKTDSKTKAAIPSDAAVEDMRDWSIENKV